MEVKPGYKLADAGVIPEDWDEAPLKGKISIAHGFAFASQHFASHGPYRLTTPGHFYEAGGFRDIAEKQKYYVGPVSADYVLEPGDLIVAMTEQAEGLLGSAALIPSEHRYLHNQRLGRVKVLSPESELAYLTYVFNTQRYRAKVRETAAGTKVKHTSPEKLLAIPVPFPPPAEQRAIAAALTDVDALISGLDRLIAKKRDLKQAAMQQLLTGQIRLPGFQGEWEVKRLGDHVTFLKNGVNSRAELTTGGSVRYLHYGDIHVANGVTLDPSAMPSIPPARVRTLDRLEDGDLVFVDASEDIDGVGKAVEIVGTQATQFVAGLHTIAARFDKHVLADGFKAYLQFCPPFRQHLRRLAAGTKVYATNRGHISGVEMALPRAKEQAAIAAVISDMDAELAALEARLHKTRALKQGMMQELLTGRTRLV